MEDNYCHACMLRFSNSTGFEKHKLKFCPFGNTLNVNKGFQRTRTQEKKWGTVSSHGFVDKVHEFSLGERHKVNVDDLQREEEQLEKEKQDIINQLDALANNFSTPREATPSTNKETSSNYMCSPSKIIATPGTLKSLNPLKAELNNDQSYYSHENQLLKSLREMYGDYVKNGGQDKEVISYFENLESDMKKFEEKTIADVEKLVYSLQEQLQNYQTANDDLRNEIYLLKENKSQAKRQVSHHSQRPNMYNMQEGEVNQQNKHMLNAESHNNSNYHERRLVEMRQEAELYRQQLELENLRHELNSLRGHPSKPILPLIGSQQYPHQHQQQQQHGFHDVVNTDNVLYQMVQQQNEEAFQSSPYDPGSGFTVFWDFASVPDRPSDCCRLLVTLYKDGDSVSDTKILPSIPLGPFGHNNGMNGQVSGSVAVLGVKQMFPQCFPMTELSLCICLQTGNRQHPSDTAGALTDCGWCKIDLFDGFNRLIVGKWKVPIRVLPIQIDMSAAQLNTVPQLGQAEIYYRLVNSRNVQTQEAALLVPQQMLHYKYAPLESYPVFALPQLAMGPNLVMKDNQSSKSEQSKKSRKQSRRSIAPSSATQMKANFSLSDLRSEEVAQLFRQSQKNEEGELLKNEQEDIRAPAQTATPRPISLPSLSHLTSENDIAVQIDRIMDLDFNLVKVVVAIYNPDGKLAHSNNGKAEFTSTYSKPAFLRDIHIYGLEKCIFTSLQWYRWSVMTLEVYGKTEETSVDELVAWTVIPLYESKNTELEAATRRSNYSISGAGMLSGEQLVSGHVNLQLFKPPALNPKNVIENIKNSIHFGEFSGASILVYVSNDIIPLIGSPAAIPIMPTHEEPPPGAWIDYARSPPEELFDSNKGFDVYIDAGRFFPDSTVAAKVILGFYDGAPTKKDPFKYRYETSFDLETNAMEPVFNTRIEFRDLTCKPQSKLVFLVYIVDAIMQQVSLLGRSVVPLFVKRNTLERAEAGNTNFCLNSGNMQLRLFQELDDKVNFDRKQLGNPVPCSTILVRIVNAICYSDGEPKRGREFPEDEWINEGILVPSPTYEEGKYDSQSCSLTPCEKELLYSLVNRSPTTVREVLMQIAPDGRKTRMDQGLINFLEGKFKLPRVPTIFELNYLVKYSSMHGLFVQIQRVQNLPWNSFTFASYCISPPASFYQGIVDDPIVLLTKLDSETPQKHPQWLNKLEVYARRMLHPNLSVLIQLYEVTTATSDFKVAPMAWTLFPVSQLGYLLHGEHQIPLFQGAPTQVVISELQSKPIMPAIVALRKKKVLKMLDAASLFLIVGDPRRIEEVAEGKMVINQTFLPKTDKFRQPVQSKLLKSLVPVGISAGDYIENMGKSFEQFISDTFKRGSTPR